MKKMLILMLLAASGTLVPQQQAAPKKLFMPAAFPQMPKIPTICIGWLEINKNISDYQEILTPLSKLVENESVDLIIIRINSGGGSPADSQIIADYINLAKQQKPIMAFISRIGASGAYWIAASCSYIICPAAAEVGSIGAVIEYVFDKDKQYHIFASGVFKAPAVNQHHELDPKFIEEQKEYCKELSKIFAQNVSEYRHIAVETILSWQAALFSGTTALKNGLVDQLGTLQDLLEKSVQLVSEKNNKTYEQLELVDAENTIIKRYQI